MRLSSNVSKTRKEVPAEEIARNAQLLIQAGFVHKEMAGVYDYLPLGLRVIERIKQVVREEMNATGAGEMLMSSLQRRDVWEKTDRWDEKKVDVWFKTKLASGTELGLGWSHEEPITDMMRSKIDSYRDLPVYVYQFQNKLRNELRAKSGILRGREFIMKDLYSYSRSEEEHQQYYDGVIESYHKIFERLGIGDKTYLTFASGGAFTQFSHEFQTLSEAGEDTIYLDEKKKIAVNEEVMSDDVLQQLGLKRGELKKYQAAEVGNIFSFGTKKSEELDLVYTDENSEQRHVVLGSYGIGITRIMGVIVELLSDEKGLVWPEEIAPADVHLIGIGDNSVEKTDDLYKRLRDKGQRVIYDDRGERPGTMFNDADLIGVPLRMVVSPKSLEAGGVEVKRRTDEGDGEVKPLDLNWLE